MRWILRPYSGSLETVLWSISNVFHELKDGKDGIFGVTYLPTQPRYSVKFLKA